MDSCEGTDPNELATLLASKVCELLRKNPDNLPNRLLKTFITANAAKHSMTEARKALSALPKDSPKRGKAVETYRWSLAEFQAADLLSTKLDNDLTHHPEISANHSKYKIPSEFFARALEEWYEMEDNKMAVLETLDTRKVYTNSQQIFADKKNAVFSEMGSGTVSATTQMAFIEAAAMLVVSRDHFHKVHIAVADEVRIDALKAWKFCRTLSNVHLDFFLKHYRQVVVGRKVNSRTLSRILESSAKKTLDDANSAEIATAAPAAAMAAQAAIMAAACAIWAAEDVKNVRRLVWKETVRKRLEQQNTAVVKDVAATIMSSVIIIAMDQVRSKVHAKAHAKAFDTFIATRIAARAEIADSSSEPMVVTHTTAWCVIADKDRECRNHMVIERALNMFDAETDDLVAKMETLNAEKSKPETPPVETPPVEDVSCWTEEIQPKSDSLLWITVK